MIKYNCKPNFVHKFFIAIDFKVSLADVDFMFKTIGKKDFMLCKLISKKTENRLLKKYGLYPFITRKINNHFKSIITQDYIYTFKVTGRFSKSDIKKGILRELKKDSITLEFKDKINV